MCGFPQWPGVDHLFEPDGAGALERAGLKPAFAEVTMKPTTEVELKGDDAARMQRLLDALDLLDDVQDVYTTAALGA